MLILVYDQRKAMGGGNLPPVPSNHEGNNGRPNHPAVKIQFLGVCSMACRIGRARHIRPHERPVVSSSMPTSTSLFTA